MSAYKKLNRQDVFISDYTAKKQWTANSRTLDEYDIDFIRAFSSSFWRDYPNDIYDGRSAQLVWNSINQLYYADTYGESQFSGSRELFLQTSLNESGSRVLREQATVLSIPRKKIGVGISPETFVLFPEQTSSNNYVEDNFVAHHIHGDNEYVATFETVYGGKGIDSGDYIVSESFYVTESVAGTPGQYIDIDHDQQSTTIIDNGEGSLIFSGSKLVYTVDEKIIGDSVYTHGQTIMSEQEIAQYYSTYLKPSLRWKSTQPIYTYNVHCKVNDSEMNFTFNPSAQTGSDGQLLNNVTGSSFTPYVTTIGLYNDNNELLAVAKTGVPVPKSQNSDMTFVVKLDI